MQQRLLGEGLEGRIVIVTGAAGGIGGATAVAAAESGAIVWALDLPGEALESAVAALPGEGHRAVGLDLSDTEAIEPAIRDLVASTDAPLWGLVHAAAYLRRKDYTEVTVADWDIQVDVNIKATFFLNRVVGDLLVEGGIGGRIINFTSVAWMTGALVGSDVYVATKGAVVSMTKGFVKRLGPAGITVNVIAPGQVDTAMQRVDNTDAWMAAAAEGTPLRRMGRPDELASVALFLLSDNASFVSGTTLNVSGGALLY
ncbi:SDR family NAD(P)-dependent oxidoreductase [Schumannella luteola]|jgi:NAD(P)-dependent dehydrogenase (short-subunit alcohol dehydrogenase family)